MKNFKKAFTITETITALSIIAGLCVFTVSTAINTGKIEERKLATTTKRVHSDLNTIYTSILLRHADNYDVRRLHQLDAPDDELSDSALLKTYFSRYLEGVDTSCENLYIMDDSVSKIFKKEELSCINARQNMTFGFYVNPECKEEYQVIEYYIEGETNQQSRYVKNVCGYVIYSANITKKFQGMFGRDIFVIPLAKRGAR